MANIVKQFTKIVFPFHFERGDLHIDEAIYTNAKGKTFKKFEPFSISAEYLRSGLDKLLDKDGGTAKIAECYRLNIDCRSCFRLPSQKNGIFQFETRSNRTFSLSLHEICLYFFESGVGFLEMEFGYASDSLQDYSELSYFLCEAKSDRNHFTHTKKLGKNPDGTFIEETYDFTMEQLIKDISRTISDGSEKLSFFYKHEKPLIYSYVLTDTKPENVDNLLYHFNKNYKDSYKFDPACLGVNTIHPFENYYWTASLSGATNLSYQTDDDITNTFFEDDFYEKALGTYYFLFLNALHQRYAISRIMAEMGNLDCLEQNHQVMEKQLRAAQACEARAVNLKFRAFFKNPSSVDHINAYHNLLAKAFDTDALYQAFSADIENLQNICTRYVTRIKARDDKHKQIKHAWTEILVLVLGIIVAEISLFKNSWDIIEKVLGHAVDFWSIAIVLLAISILSPIIPVYINVKRQCEKIHSLRVELKEEFDQNLVEDDRARRKSQKKAKRDEKKKRKEEKKKCKNNMQ